MRLCEGGITGMKKRNSRSVTVKYERDKKGAVHRSEARRKKRSLWKLAWVLLGGSWAGS
jgi:hypothetical protein